MRALLILILLFLLNYSAKSQNCQCPSEGDFKGDGNAFKEFLFSNNEALGLCGSFEVKNKDTIYSGITLFQCGQNKVINEWGEIESCKIKKNKDSLFVEALYGLPIGRDFNTVWVPFYIEKIFLNNFEFRNEGYFLKDLKKYNKQQIAKVLSKYHKLTKGNYDHTIDVANMLFWAYVSGSKEAELYLNEIAKKFGPFDGAIAEEWDDISATYDLWKEKNKHN